MLIHYLDGKWLEDDQLKISAFDITVLRGFGVFDFLRTYKKKPFRLEDHLNRLNNSANELLISVPASNSELTDIIHEGIKLNTKETAEFNIRIVVTGGVSEDSISVGKGSLIVIFAPGHDYPEEHYSKGVKVATFPVSRHIPQAKSINYMAGVKALAKARKQSAIELIHIDNSGNMYEGMTSNFFAVINGKLTTAREGILEGITKKVILDELVPKLGIEINERFPTLSEIPSFSEAFVTASNKEVMPIHHIDDHQVGNGLVGPITTKLITEFRKITRS